MIRVINNRKLANENLQSLTTSNLGI